MTETAAIERHISRREFFAVAKLILCEEAVCLFNLACIVNHAIAGMKNKSPKEQSGLIENFRKKALLNFCLMAAGPAAVIGVAVANGSSDKQPSGLSQRS